MREERFFERKKQHPLKAEFRKRKIPLWLVRDFTGIPEPKLSRYLNNIDRMPLDVQINLYRMIEIMDGNFECLEKIKIPQDVFPNAELKMEKDNKE